MIKDLIDKYKLNGLKKEDVINLPGKLNRSDRGYLYYTIAQPYFMNILPLYNKLLVIKIK